MLYINEHEDTAASQTSVNSVSRFEQLRVVGIVAPPCNAERLQHPTSGRPVVSIDGPPQREREGRRRRLW